MLVDDVCVKTPYGVVYILRCPVCFTEFPVSLLLASPRGGLLEMAESIVDFCVVCNSCLSIDISLRVEVTEL